VPLSLRADGRRRSLGGRAPTGSSVGGAARLAATSHEPAERAAPGTPHGPARLTLHTPPTSARPAVGERSGRAASGRPDSAAAVRAAANLLPRPALDTALSQHLGGGAHLARRSGGPEADSASGRAWAARVDPERARAAAAGTRPRMALPVLDVGEESLRLFSPRRQR
jgi:hypothetical protein